MPKTLLITMGLLSASILFAATDLPATITTDTTLAKSGNPHYLRSDVNIAAGVTLTLQAGVQVIAAGDYRLFVNGTLTGNGTSAMPCLLRGPVLNARGGWQGLYVSRGGRCELTHTSVKNAATAIMCAGGTLSLDGCLLALSTEDGLLAWNDATVQVNSCKFYSNTGRGLRLEGDQAQGQISNCDFRSNGGYPVRLKANLVDMLRNGNRYAKNGRQRISVSCSLTDDITDTDTWVRQSVPFELGAEETGQTLNIASRGKLTIPAGTTLLADRIDCRGELRVEGSAAQPCVVQPRTGGRGGWQGLNLYPAGKGVLSHATVRCATTGITADGAALELSDSAVSNCRDDGLRLTGTTALTLVRDTLSGHGRNGLRLEGQAMTGSVTDCAFAGNQSHPVWALARNVALLGTGNEYLGNTPQLLAVSCGGNPDLATGIHNWTAQGVPLDLTVNPAGSTLNVAAAATLNLAAGQTLYLGGMLVKGTLNVNGTSDQLARFLPAPGLVGPGAWNGLQFDGGGGILSGVSVEGAISALSLQNASPTLSGCRLRGSQYDGLACSGTSQPVVTGCEIADNGRHGVYITGSAQPNLGDLTTATTADDGGNTLGGNGGYDVYNATPGAIRAQNNTWPSSDAAAIALRIFDHGDDASRGAVVFSPVRAPAAASGFAAGPPCSLRASAARGGSVDISWTQATRAEVDVRVVSLSGRPVAFVCRALSTGQGTTRINWSRISVHGTRVPAGCYLVLLEARRTDGTRHRLMTPLRLP